jgi:hypothetical protein
VHLDERSPVQIEAHQQLEVLLQRA